MTGAVIRARFLLLALMSKILWMASLSVNYSADEPNIFTFGPGGQQEVRTGHAKLF